MNVCPPVDQKAKMAGDVSVKGGQAIKVDTTPKTDGVRFTGLCTRVAVFFIFL